MGMEIKVDEWVEGIKARVWEKIGGNDGKFDARIKELEKFVEEFERLPDRNSENKIERSLSQWCKEQRSLYRNGLITDDKINQLEKISGWYWDNDEHIRK